MKLAIVRRSAAGSLTALAAVVSMTVAAGAATHHAAPSEAGASRPAGTSSVSGPTVVAVGDIACESGEATTATRCQQDETATLARTYNPKRVLVLGDLQYESGSLFEFRHSYDESWGALKSVTKPIPGNHEYRTPGASGYYTYFKNQQPGGPGYYAFNIDNWRVYALNSNCTFIDCDRQTRWMNRDMRNNPRRCSAVMTHHPLFSSGAHGSSPEARRFWDVAYKHGADIALAGHDHDYERFQRMNPSGVRAADGLVSFVSGAGGKSLYGFGEIVDGSLVRDNHDSGVLALTLGETQFAFEYKTTDGQIMDSGIRTCR